MIIKTNTFPRSVYQGGALTLSAHFVDEATNLDVAPDDVFIELWTGTTTIQNQFGDSSATAPISSFTMVTAGTSIEYRAEIPVGASMATGIWTYWWQGANSAGTGLVLERGSFVVED